MNLSLHGTASVSYSYNHWWFKGMCCNNPFHYHFLLFNFSIIHNEYLFFVKRNKVYSKSILVKYTFALTEKMTGSILVYLFRASIIKYLTANFRTALNTYKIYNLMWGLLVKYTDKETQVCQDTMPKNGSFENHYKNMTAKSQILNND